MSVGAPALPLVCYMGVSVRGIENLLPSPLLAPLVEERRFGPDRVIRSGDLCLPLIY